MKRIIGPSIVGSTISKILGYRDFKPEENLTRFVTNSKYFNSEVEDVSKAQALKIFETSRQLTWLVSTSERLYCILDDISDDKLHINWSIPKEDITTRDELSIQIKAEDKTEDTGLVDIGEFRNWLYSKRFFEEEEKSIVESVNKLIIDSMLPQPAQPSQPAQLE